MPAANLRLKKKVANDASQLFSFTIEQQKNGEKKARHKQNKTSTQHPFYLAAILHENRRECTFKQLRTNCPQVRSY